MELKDTNGNILGKLTSFEFVEPYCYEWACLRAENGKFKRKLYVKKNGEKFAWKHVGRGQVYLHDSPKSLVIYGQKKHEDGSPNKCSVIFSFKCGQLRVFYNHNDYGLRRMGFYTTSIIDKVLSYKVGKLDSKKVKDYILQLIKDKMAENGISYKNCDSLENFLKIQQYKFLQYSADIRFTDIDRSLFNLLAQKFKTKNVVKNCLGVSTKKTRKLFFQSLKQDEFKTFCYKVAVFHSFYEMGYKLDHLYKILEFKGRLDGYLSPTKWRKKGCEYVRREEEKKKFDTIISLIGENRFFGEDIHYFNSESMTNDTCQFIERIKKYDSNFKPRRYKSLRDAHDSLYKILLEYKHKPFDLNQTINEDSFKFLEYPQVADSKAYKGDYYQFVIPQTSKDLRSWGDTLHHCVGTYAEAVKDGRTNILGIYKNGELTYCLEITNFDPWTKETDSGRKYTIGQFKGKFNENPSEEDDRAIREFLIDNAKFDHNISLDPIRGYHIGVAQNNAAAGELVEIR